LAVLVACASTQQYLEIGAVVGDFRSDEVAATVKYTDKPVGLRGRVVEKGMKSGKAAETQGFGSVGGPWSSKTVLVSKNYGYLVLESERERDAKTVCLFESTMLEELSPVREGQTVNLRCLFSKIVGERKNPVPAFYGCTVDQ
jgi:hypothetical protein